MSNAVNLPMATTLSRHRISGQQNAATGYGYRDEDEGT
jgi:hypothetical protein